MSEHGTEQAILRVVGDAQCIGLIVIRQQRDDRPEDFFLRDAHAAGHIGKQRGIEIAALRHVGAARAAADQRCTLGLTARHIAFDAL